MRLRFSLKASIVACLAVMVAGSLLFSVFWYSDAEQARDAYFLCRGHLADPLSGPHPCFSRLLEMRYGKPFLRELEKEFPNFYVEPDRRWLAYWIPRHPDETRTDSSVIVVQFRHQLFRYVEVPAGIRVTAMSSSEWELHVEYVNPDQVRFRARFALEYADSPHDLSLDLIADADFRIALYE